MPVLHRDFEARSTVSLKTAGAWRYANDASTEVLCIGYAIDDGAVEIWTPGQAIPEAFLAAASEPGWLAVAHNDPGLRSRCATIPC